MSSRQQLLYVSLMTKQKGPCARAGKHKTRTHQASKLNVELRTCQHALSTRQRPSGRTPDAIILTEGGDRVVHPQLSMPSGGPPKEIDPNSPAGGRSRGNCTVASPTPNCRAVAPPKGPRLHFRRASRDLLCFFFSSEPCFGARARGTATGAGVRKPRPPPHSQRQPEWGWILAKPVKLLLLPTSTLAGCCEGTPPPPMVCRKYIWSAAPSLSSHHHSK